MKVILQEDIEKLGKKYDVKEVADGYARNFLFPKNLAIIATAKELEKIEELKKELETQEGKKLEKIQELVSEIDNYQLTILVKTGEENQLFESINSIKIAKALEDNGFKIDKKQIILKDPIKELGEFKVKIDFDLGLEAKIKVIIEAEKE